MHPASAGIGAGRIGASGSRIAPGQKEFFTVM